MRRLSYLSVPVFVATAVLVLASATLGAQQPAEKSASAPASACCGNTISDATNHAAGGGCCGAMAAKAGATADHSEHAEHQAATAAKADAKPMDHGAGCCAGMSHGVTAKADDKAAGGCCANMKADGAADPHAGHTADAKSRSGRVPRFTSLAPSARRTDALSLSRGAASRATQPASPAPALRRYRRRAPAPPPCDAS